MGNVVSKDRIRRSPRTEQTPVAPFRILDLPPELISSICSHLDDKEALGIRYICRALNEGSMPILGKRLFSHLIVILHPISLAALLEIAKHPRFFKYVEEVTVCGDRLGYEVLDRGARYEDEDDSVAEINNRDHRELHDSFEESEFPTVLLRHAFRSLPSLRVVRTYSYCCLLTRKVLLMKALDVDAQAYSRTGRWMRQSKYHVLRVPILQITLPAIAEIDPKGLLTLDVTLVAPQDPALSRDEHMNFDQQLWKSITANREVRINVIEDLNLDGLSNFLKMRPMSIRFFSVLTSIKMLRSPGIV